MLTTIFTETEPFLLDDMGKTEVLCESVAKKYFLQHLINL